MREEWEAPAGASGEAREVRVRRLPSPGVAAVLSVFLPGLGHVYAGRLAVGAIWFLATSFAYWVIFLPGFALHFRNPLFSLFCGSKSHCSCSPLSWACNGSP